MTETLQEKIDAIFHNPISQHWTAYQTYKAIQELREEIKQLHKYKGETSQGVDIAKVLALIGEKEIMEK